MALSGNQTKPGFAEHIASAVRNLKKTLPLITGALHHTAFWLQEKSGTISLEEMLDKGRQPGALQDKATAKIEALKGGKHKHKKKAAQKEMEDLGQILRS